MALCADEGDASGMLAMEEGKVKKAPKDSNEAQFLENSLIKIGQLLGLCFG